MGNLAKIVNDLGKLEEYESGDEFLKVVNTNPPTTFIKEHPLAKGVKYMPIDKVELLLTMIFQQWNVEVLREGVMLNSVYVTVRVNYKHPISGEWTHQDGVGAVAIQVDKGHDASELAFIKSNAIMLGLPSAKSYAIKDAAENIGKLFGRDLNRKDTMAFTPSYTTSDDEKKQAIKDKLNADN